MTKATHGEEQQSTCTAAATAPAENAENDNHNQDDEDSRNTPFITAFSSSIIVRSVVLSFGCGNDGISAFVKAPVKITAFEIGFYLVFYDPLCEDIRQ